MGIVSLQNTWKTHQRHKRRGLSSNKND